MKYFGHVIAVTGLVAGFAFPAFAASHKMDATMMTCADFSAMDADGQMKAMEVMAMESEGMTTDQMSSEDTMASDEASSDAMASDDASSDAMASDDMATDAMMATAKTCTANPDMMAMDAMMADKG